MHDLPCVLVPGGVTLPPTDGEDAGKVQTIGARFAHGEITLEEAAELGCRACASPGGGCQFLGTAATSQVVGEALGLSLPHSALAPSGQPIWLDMARRSARAVAAIADAQASTRAHILTDAAVRNAMAVHAAFGGSTNLLLHIPAIAYHAGLRRPTVEDWIAINRRVPRLVDALPNGPVGHPTVRVFLAGGVPEVMLHLRRLGLLDEICLTVDRRAAGPGARLVGDVANAAQRLRDVLREQGRRRSRRRHHESRAGPAARPDLHGDVPARQPGPGRLGHQEHGHRPERGRCRRRLPQDRPGARLHQREGGHRGHQEPRARRASSPATSSC